MMSNSFCQQPVVMKGRVSIRRFLSTDGSLPRGREKIYFTMIDIMFEFSFDFQGEQSKGAMRQFLASGPSNSTSTSSGLWDRLRKDFRQSTVFPSASQRENLTTSNRGRSFNNRKSKSPKSDKSLGPGADIDSSILFGADPSVNFDPRGKTVNPEGLHPIDVFFANVLIDSMQTSTNSSTFISESPNYSRTRLPKARSISDLVSSLTPTIKTVPEDSDAHLIASNAWQV